MRTIYFKTMRLGKAIFLFATISLVTLGCKVDEQENASDKYNNHNARPTVSLGENVSYPIDSTVTLDKTEISDPEGETINPSWVITSKPAESTAVLLNDDTLFPSLTLDVTGDFTIRLRADDGLSTSSDTITITSYNTAPVVSVGGQSISRLYGVPTTLDGTYSKDLDGHPLSYNWALTSKPTGSSASLSHVTTATPEITFDVTGDYEVSLTVSDGYQSSTKNIKVISYTQKLSDTGLKFRDSSSGYGQDADYTINPPSFKVNDISGDGNPANDTVLDNNTGLLWYRGISSSKTFAEADIFCSSLNYPNSYGNNSSGWRVPTVRELRGLQDFRSSGVISTVFTNSSSYTYLWSSDTYAFVTNEAWVVSFQDADAKVRSKSSTASVRCVNGDIQKQNLKDNGDSTVTDYLHGLQWQKGEGGNMKFSVGLSYCNNLKLGGYTDWRLPNTKEMSSLVDYTQHEPAIDKTIFTDALEADYMTSTSANNYGSHDIAYIISFYNGGSGGSIYTGDWSSYRAQVRCVRGGY